ncbi:bifunctional glutamate N-acetyltransferase/amino-acid acetyltransferase ArgJ [Candidatus Poribacteria bacterium]|nr:bifunctional glutamate N-acetyltransferase/amino-acid acetyltransferase ArgJ [Candidatus Poribacteria bacterium]
MSDTFDVIDGGVAAAVGFEAGSGEGGIRYRDRHDVGMIRCDRRASAAGVFTRNLFSAAPIHVCREHLAQTHGFARAVVVNAGNANACTGDPGLAAAREMAAETARLLGIDAREVLVASTGVIGEPLPMGAVRKGITAAAGALGRGGGDQFARSIMTTDTTPKVYAIETSVGGSPLRIGGCCKGAGMIAPNMATMLCFLTTDADIDPALLQILLRQSVARSFNRVSVDGDQSTNDTVLILASGAGPRVESHTSSERQFADALTSVCQELAIRIAHGGEGATKLIEVTVVGGRDDGDAERAARAVAESNLVKTAVYGNDANWGRILCAIGYSGAAFDPYATDLWIEDLQLVRGGMRTDYQEADATALFSRDPLHIRADLHAGSGEATFWTCDLTEGYIQENASYRS